ncbi:murein biosynthesis integral membrane protein MurJ [Georgenia sp. TF02-10]|uniref:murein biosynthesis integral membrane protein MurJ n=1 Tax=Georgenia sp. TF02-10 TaxID=2917725 RepID=UPI001FA6DCFA|nr:murein biosynthesis integral membrane protein MurJ [Georgenia sp. TF02-10]UNX54955.1 murein biosynthesis integral membrane protein MurJ [Georgenia sp. TF02-10]
MSEPSRGVASSSIIMFAGTLVSRVLGVVKSPLLIGAAIGINTGAMNAFSVANKLPNVIYMLIAGGVLNAVLVPQIVRAIRAHDDGGQAYVNRLLTLGMAALGGVTVLLTLASPLLIRLYAAQISPEWFPVAVTFGYWCIPQLFFYGMYTLLGQVLNARGIFGPYMWAPALNNVVAIAGLVLFLGVFGGVGAQAAVGADVWTTPRVAVLAGTATLGIAAQALVLLRPLRRSGFRFRPTWGLRGSGLGRASKVALWVFAALAMNQAAYVVVSNAAAYAPAAGGYARDVAGNAAYDASFLLYTLPTSLVTVSIVTALFTRMSGAAAGGEVDRVRADLSLALRTVGVFTVFATGAVMVLALPVVRVITGTVTFAEARSVAQVLVAMVGGLVAVGVFTVAQRVYYAMEDARGLFRLQVPMVLVLAAGAGLSMLLPPRLVVVGVGVAMTLSNTLGALLTYLGLRRHLRTIDGGRVLRTHLRLVLAAVPACGAGWVLLHLLGTSAADLSVVGSLWRVVVVGVVMGALYVAGLRALDVTELGTLTAPVGRMVMAAARRVPGPAGRVLRRVGAALVPGATAVAATGGPDDAGPDGPDDGGPGGDGGGPGGDGPGSGPDGGPGGGGGGGSGDGPGAGGGLGAAADGDGPDGGGGPSDGRTGGGSGPGAAGPDQGPDGDRPHPDGRPGARPVTPATPATPATPSGPVPRDPAAPTAVVHAAVPPPPGGAAFPPVAARSVALPSQDDEGRPGAAAGSWGSGTLDTIEHTVGVQLGGRYDLTAELAPSPAGARQWRAWDTILAREVTVLAVPAEHPRAADVIDAARRASLVEDHRLVRILDAGTDAGTAFVVTDVVHGTDLAALAAAGPLAPAQARAVVGEAASALESARRHGVRHLALAPASLRVTEDGDVVLTGLATEAALLGVGGPEESPLTAARRDAEDLVHLLALALTGAPGTAPTEPADLARLCARTAAGEGPRSTGELIRELAPWGDVDPAALPRPSVRVPAGAVVAAGTPAPAPAGARPVPPPPPPPPAEDGTGTGPDGAAVGAGTDAYGAGASAGAGADADADADAAANGPEAGAGADAGARGTRAGVTVPPPPPPPPSDAPAPSAAESAPGGTDDGEPAAAGTPHPVDRRRPAGPRWAPGHPPARPAPDFTEILRGEPTGAAEPAGEAPARHGEPGGDEPAKRTDQGPSRHARLAGALTGLRTRAAQAARSARATAADRTRTAAAGLGTAVAAGRTKVAEAAAARRGPQSSAGPDTRPVPVRPRDVRDRPADDETLLPADVDGPEVPFRERRMDPTPVVLVAVGALVLVLFLISLRVLVAPPPEVEIPRTSPTSAAPPTETPPPSPEPTPEPTTPPPAPPQAAALAPLDPQGDGAENPDLTSRALDGDPMTFWRSRSYVDPQYGIKEGIGLTVTLAQPATVSQVELDVLGSGGVVQVRTGDPAQPTAGQVLAEGTMGPGTVLTFEPVETDHLILWFPQLPVADSDGKNRIELAELRVG